ncbi:MAG TPA: hypothetical protein PLX02_02055 [Syntrophorhabdaceae bacterium]|nr:hypothetical protein [Syntrophorhabdaceae bacterium]
MKNKIRKAAKIIRHEGFSVFAGKLTRKVVYGICDAAAASCHKGKRNRLTRYAHEERFTVKKVAGDTMQADERARTEKLLADVKTEILKETGR